MYNRKVFPPHHGNMEWDYQMEDKAGIEYVFGIVGIPEVELSMALQSAVGSKAELKQRLVEHLEKEGEDLSTLEFEYNTEGREQTDKLRGTKNTATAREKHSEEKGEDGANAVVMKFMQQMQQKMQQQMQPLQQMQHMKQMQQQTQQQGQ
uniref:Uncharacterized protein n=1 Tax=Glossina austeni TaxID=7395 RepID=A0A1A9VJB0_GLOAU